MCGCRRSIRRQPLLTAMIQACLTVAATNWWAGWPCTPWLTGRRLRQQPLSVSRRSTSGVPVAAATACVVPFLLDPAAALGRMSPRHMALQCLDLAAVFLLGVPSAVCTRLPLTASVLARLRLRAWSSAHAWLFRLRTGSDVAPERLRAPDPVLHVSDPRPVRRALWPMPAWVWRDVRSGCFLFFGTTVGMCICMPGSAVDVH